MLLNFFIHKFLSEDVSSNLTASFLIITYLEKIVKQKTVFHKIIRRILVKIIGNNYFSAVGDNNPQIKYFEFFVNAKNC